MMKIGFDNDKYVRLQSERIRQRISEFGGKLYLEFGGKLFDDFHASRVLPGFQPDSKIKMLLEMKDEAEVIIAISAGDIERNKRRGDLGITYDMEALRLIDAFRAAGLYVGGVCITHCREQETASQFQKRLESLNIPVYRQYIIPDYPANVSLIVSPEGFGKSDTLRVTAVVGAALVDGGVLLRHGALPLDDAELCRVEEGFYFRCDLPCPGGDVRAIFLPGAEVPRNDDPSLVSFRVPAPPDDTAVHTKTPCC